MPNPVAYPLFGTGQYFAVASGTGTQDDPYVPAIELTAPPGYIANPLIATLDAGTHAITNAGHITASQFICVAAVPCSFSGVSAITTSTIADSAPGAAATKTAIEALCTALGITVA